MTKFNDLTEPTLQHKSHIADNTSNSNDIYIIGVGRNTILYIDLAEICGYNIKGLVHYNDSRTGEIYFGHKIIGSHKDFLPIITGKNIAISVGDNNLRAELYNNIIANGGIIPTLIHPSAIISKYAIIKRGAIVHANSVISPNTEIGENTVISSNDMITHGCKIGKHCFVASNTIVGADVVIKDYVFIGSGATIVSGRVSSIETKSIIGAGSVVTKDIGYNMKVKGNPAK